MVFIEKCCCGCSLKKGVLIICYYVLTQEIFTFVSLTLIRNDPSPNAFYLSRNESKSQRYFHTWTVAFNIIVICTGLYGIYKQKAPFMIPFLAYRMVNLIFMTFTLANSRMIADTLGEEFAKPGVGDEKRIDFLPLVVIALTFAMGLDFYCLLVVFSYYKQLMQNTTMIAVAVPVVVYSQHTPDETAYAQPASNPYVVDAKFAQHYNPIYRLPPPNYAYSHSSMRPPPPYRT